MATKEKKKTNKTEQKIEYPIIFDTLWQDELVAGNDVVIVVD